MSKIIAQSESVVVLLFLTGHQVKMTNAAFQDVFTMVVTEMICQLAFLFNVFFFLQSFSVTKFLPFVWCLKNVLK